MGGKSLKDNGKIVTSRLELKEYLSIKKHVIEFMSTIIKCDIIPELPDKDSFGDLDVLCDGDCNIISQVREYYKPKYEYHNGCVYSFSFDCQEYLDKNIWFQIDLFFVNNLEMAKCYFSYGDVGKILGAIVNHYGLKYGHEGLWCYIIKPNFTEKLSLSKDPKYIFDYLGLDYDYYMNEIPKLKKNEYHKIYDWIMESKFFNQNVFDSLNNDHRRYIRQFYLDFFKYIDVDISKSNGNNKQNDYDIMDSIKYFNKDNEHDEILKKHELDTLRKKKFSQREFINLYHEIRGIKLVKEEIGYQISEFKNYCSKNCDWNEYLDANTYESVRGQILIYLKKN